MCCNAVFCLWYCGRELRLLKLLKSPPEAYCRGCCSCWGCWSLLQKPPAEAAEAAVAAEDGEAAEAAAAAETAEAAEAAEAAAATSMAFLLHRLKFKTRNGFIQDSKEMKQSGYVGKKGRNNISRRNGLWRCVHLAREWSAGQRCSGRSCPHLWPQWKKENANICPWSVKLIALSHMMQKKNNKKNKIIKHLIRSGDKRKNKPPQTRFDKYFLEVFFLFFFTH